MNEPNAACRGAVYVWPMQPPGVSIVIPVRNGAPYIAEAIASALDQGDIVHEVVVVDDGSKDATLQVVRALRDPRIRLLARSPGAPPGVSAVRNEGLAVARGDWVLFLDADDRLKPGAIAALAAAAAACVAVYADYDRIDSGGRRIGRRRMIRGRRKPSGEILERLLAGNFIVNGGIVLIRTETFRSLGGFAENLRFCEDWHAWCRLAAQGRIVYLPDTHVLDYRVHAKSTMMHGALTLQIFDPALRAVFEDPLLNSKIPAERLARLRRHAETHLRTYLVAQSLRSGRYAIAAARLASALWRDPVRAPRTLLASAAALAGI